MSNLSKSTVKSATQFARAVSWMGHPLVFVTVSVGIVVVSRLARRDALSILLVLFCFSDSANGSTAVWRRALRPLE